MIKKIYIVLEDGHVFEGKSFGASLAAKIQSTTGIETRFNEFGHIVRGGDPSLRDRVAASRMGAKAVELLLEGKSNLIVCERNSKIVAVDINYARTLDNMYKNKLKPGDLDGYTEEQIAEMKAFCEEKRAFVRELYDLANGLSK